jgi:hypothetical protein
MTFTRRIGKGAGPDGLALTIIPIWDRSDFDASVMRPETEVSVVKDVWCTFNGDWNVKEEDRFGIDAWARQNPPNGYYRAPSDPLYNDDAGGDHHILMMVEDAAGVPCPGAGFAATSDGAWWLQPPVNTNHVIPLVAKAHGWANLGMYASSLSYPPTPGPWSITRLGWSEQIVGFGMPYKLHVSIFCVFKTVRWSDIQATTYPTLQAQVIDQADRHQLIQFNPTAALQKAIFAAGFVPNGPEFETVRDGVRFIAQRAEQLGTGEVRAYFVRVGDWGNVTYFVREK